MAGHLSPPVQAPTTPPVPSPTQSCAAVSMEMPLFAPRPPASQDSLSGEVGQLQPEAPNCPPTLPPQVPPPVSSRRARWQGPASGQSAPLGLASEQTLGLSLLQSLSSLGSEPGPRCPHGPHSAGLGRAEGVGRTVGTSTWLAPVELHSVAAPLCASLTQCPSGGVAREVSFC